MPGAHTAPGIPLKVRLVCTDPGGAQFKPPLSWSIRISDFPA